MLCRKCGNRHDHFVEIHRVYERHGVAETRKQLWCVNCVVAKAIMSKFKGGD